MNERIPGSESTTARVREYMTADVETVAPEDTVATVAEWIAESGHDGFPVCADRRVEGFVSATDLLLAADDDPVSAVMSQDLVVADPEMAIADAARVILRSGIRKLPVVDDDGDLVGIISNADIVRSQIERATPEKVGKLSRTLASLHGVDVTKDRRAVELSALRPTQSEVYADELEGRVYELERGLAEPLVVIDTPETLLLADGHHRVLAADRLGIASMDAYVIVIDEPIQLGMERTAHSQGLSSIDDIEVVDYARHPLVETINRLQ
jgi:IMP dehydrogenase